MHLAILGNRPPFGVGMVGQPFGQVTDPFSRNCNGLGSSSRLALRLNPAPFLEGGSATHLFGLVSPNPGPAAVVRLLGCRPGAQVVHRSGIRT